MSQAGTPNPNPTPTPGPTPAGSELLSEEQLVDLIDGVLPDAEAKRLIERAGRSDLLIRVHAMRRQRDILASLPEEQAPAELHDRVLAALERDALVGISTGESSGPPVSSLRLTDGDARARPRRLLIHRAPGLALAAGLALLVVGGAYFASQAWRGAGHTTITPDTTSPNRSASTRIATATPTDASDTTTQSTVATTMADGAGETANAEMALAKAAPTGAAAGVTMMASEEPSAPERARSAYAKQTVTLERAVQLASEGRLAIRVTPATLRGLGEIERAGERRSADRQWRLSKSVPPALLAAALPALDDRKPQAGPPRPDQGIIMAAALVRPIVGPGAAYSLVTAPPSPPPVAPGASLAPDPQSRLHASYVIDLPRTESAFDILRTVFREKLKGEVRFVELDEPVATPAQREASDEIWWDKPPAQWSPRVAVPVLVERPRGGA